MRQNVTIKVPATSANMGPGFDCLGIALDIWNTIEVDVGQSGFEILGEGADDLPRDDSNLVHRSISLALNAAGESVPKLRITCRNDIPLARGLGSSSAAAVGGLMAGNVLCGEPLPHGRLLELAAEIEGHPDNAAAALGGGCQIVVREDSELVSASVPVPDGLQAVVYIPETPMPTEQARQVLPTHIDLADAVYNIGRAAMLVSAFSTGELKRLTVATGDRLHQPARQTIFPAMKNIIRAAIDAGALGVFLSGAGSSVLALTCGREWTIGCEMADAAAKSGLEGTVKITRPTRLGAHLVEGP